MNTSSPLLYSLIASFLLLLSNIGTAQDQDGIIALGIVNSDTSIFQSFNTVGGTVTVTKQTTGYYILSLEAANAFSTLDFSDLYIHVTQLNTPNVAAKATISSKTESVVRFQVFTDHLEDNSSLSSSTPTDAPFTFAIFRSPSSGASRYLAATGTVNADGTLAGGTAIGNYTLSSEKTAPNDYFLKLTKPEGFQPGAAEDNTMYIIQVASVGAGPDDETFISYPLPVINGEKGFQVSSKDQQAGSDPGDPTDGQPFYFNIYRVDPSQIEVQARSKLLVALARVKFDGTLNSNPNPMPGTTVSSTRDSPGNFFVTIHSPGRFAGYSSTDLSLQLSHDFANNSDKIIIGNITVIDDDNVFVHVSPNDVQQSGNGTGVPSSSGFFLLLTDAKGSIQPDLRIGEKRNLSRMKGDNRINNSGNGQQTKLEPVSYTHLTLPTKRIV